MRSRRAKPDIPPINTNLLSQHRLTKLRIPIQLKKWLIDLYRFESFTKNIKLVIEISFHVSTCANRFHQDAVWFSTVLLELQCRVKALMMIGMTVGYKIAIHFQICNYFDLETYFRPRKLCHHNYGVTGCKEWVKNRKGNTLLQLKAIDRHKKRRLN